MASASPTLHTARAAGWIDLQKSGEYPIVLGESLRDSDGSDQLLNLRYNWQPKAGFGSGRSNLRATKDGYRLTVKDASDAHAPSLVYSGHPRPTSAEESDEPSPLALVFDRKEAVFKLEAISKSIDLNLESSSSEFVNVPRPAKLPKSPIRPPREQTNGHLQPKADDETPDPKNPFDFRNFLKEAKENVESASHPGGNRTPIPGNRTPASGFASPVPGATRFRATSPQFRATPISSPAPKKRKTGEATKAQRLASPMRQKPAQKKRKPVEVTQKPLSKARISDSDDELSDTIVVATPSNSKQTHPKGHYRNVSEGFGRSPHIVVNDGDLEIDMGSPPADNRGRSRGRINPDAFRSNTGTPVMGMSSNRRPPADDLRMKDPDEGHSEDGDVEELELGSPRASRMSIHGSRSASVVEPTSRSVQDHAPTPPNQVGDDDDDLLAAELEAALEEEEDEEEESKPDTADRGQGYGLGISGAAQREDGDDESEVSEEE
jgi:RNA polymerase II transcription elongation factor